MRLHILTPLATILDRTDITEISARDESGAFGIRTGHAPFLTALPASVLTLRTEHGATLYAAVAGGMLRVDRDGVRVISPDAATGPELAPLAARVSAEKAAAQRLQRDGEAQERTLHAALVHHLLDSVTSDKAGDA